MVAHFTQNLNSDMLPIIGNIFVVLLDPFLCQH